VDDTRILVLYLVYPTILFVENISFPVAEPDVPYLAVCREGYREPLTNGEHIPLYLVSYYLCCGECRNLCFLYQVHYTLWRRFLCALYQVPLSCSGGYSFPLPLLQVYPNIL